MDSKNSRTDKVRRRRKTAGRILALMRREVGIYVRRPIFLFCMFLAPIICILFFTSLMDDGLPAKLPAAIVDEDNTHISRIICRTIGAFKETDVSRRYNNFTDARRAMQKGEIYAFYLIPRGTTQKALANKRPHVSFYTNDAYYVPANLLMKDMKTASELLGLAITRESLYARGATERSAMGVLQPIVIETHPLGNAALDYSVYLSNMLVPGIIILLILLTTTYSIGYEWKRHTQTVWFGLSGRNVPVALLGKLLPQTLVYSLIMMFMDVYFFRYLGFPCRCGLFHMILLSELTIVAAQSFGIFLFGIMAGRMRLAMCICSLWGILSFSLAGFTYPTTAMAPILRLLANAFPLRHYYLIYVNQALYGYDIRFVWGSVVALLIFCALPAFVLQMYRYAVLYIKYEK